VSELRDLIDIVARALAEEPNKVRVSEVEHHGTILLEVYAAPRDMGKMIGRQGRTIAAMRTLAGVTGERLKKRVTLEVRDEPPPN
jgi:predicted RNA-binding protein YlqC (UPF0109 family)